MKRMTPMTRSRMGLVALALAAVTVPLPVAAQVIERQAANEKPATVEGTIGMRGTLIRSSGFDPFSSTDLLPQVSLSLAAPVRSAKARSVSPRAWPWTTARPTPTHAERRRRSRPGGCPSCSRDGTTRGRYAYAFARLAPGMLRAAAVLNDASSPNGNQLADHFDLPAVDGSAGAALPHFRPREPGRRLDLRRGRLRLGPQPPPLPHAGRPTPRSGEAGRSRPRDDRPPRRLHAPRPRDHLLALAGNGGLARARRGGQLVNSCVTNIGLVPVTGAP